MTSNNTNNNNDNNNTNYNPLRRPPGRCAGPRPRAAGAPIVSYHIILH